MRTAVVFLVFNRPDLTARVLEQIRAARPPTLLVVADGPRPDDHARVAAVRALIEAGVDWPCDLRREYATANLGCGPRVASGLDWAFSQVEEAIILEDDCRPDPSFFPFAEAMLARYRDEPRVMHIGGTNLLAPRMRRRRAAWWFSRHAWVWGWATWRRAWRHYDYAMTAWDERLAALRASFATGWERAYWERTLDYARRHPAHVNTWDYAWQFTCRSLGGLAVLPTRNLVENLGFGHDHTHTPAALRRLHRPAEATGPLTAPARLRASPYWDEQWTRVYIDDPPTLRNNLASRVRGVWAELTRGRERFVAGHRGLE